MTATPMERSGSTAAVERYLELIGAGEEAAAVAMVTDLLAAGLPPETVLLDVIGTAQVHVGQLWADNHWSVAREHAATAISERAVAAVTSVTAATATAARTPAGAGRGRITAACVDGEWHSLPVRLVTEVLRLRGWWVDYLGAAVPGPHLVAHLHQTDTDAVALSCLLPTRLPRAHAAIAASHTAGVPVLAGGPGFGPDGRYARLLGAAGWAARADAAADRLAAPDWPPRPVPQSRPPHQPGEEYHRLTARRAELVAAGQRGLAQRYQPAAGYDQRQQESTVDDLGHILDFLAAAVYVDDPAVFGDFTAWTVRVLAARGVPAVALAAGLEVLGNLLPDEPRAREILAAAAGKVRAGT